MGGAILTTAYTDNRRHSNTIEMALIWVYLRPPLQGACETRDQGANGSGTSTAHSSIASRSHSRRRMEQTFHRIEHPDIRRTADRPVHMASPQPVDEQ